MSKIHTVTVVDLDGTLCQCNTFHAFVFYLMKQAFRYGNILLLAKIILWTGLRTIRIIPHKRWKFQLLKNNQNKKIDLDNFVNTLQPKLNQFVIEESKKYNIRVLATAAPELYAQKIAEKYNFTHIVATKTSEKYSDFRENIQSTKFKQVKALLKELSVSDIDLIFTDHIDDALLIKDAKKSWLINANQVLKAYVKAENLSHQVKYIEVNEK